MVPIRDQGMRRTVGRVLDIIEMLVKSPAPIGVVEVSRALGMPKSSASVLLSTLHQRRYVNRNEAGRYSFNHGFDRAWAGGVLARLLTVAKPIMIDLGRDTGETIFIGVLLPTAEVRYIDKVVSPNVIRYDTELSTRPAHCTSIGRVLLAHQSEEDVRLLLAGISLRRYTSRTIATTSGLRAELARVREQGYAVNIDEHVMGASGVAAPIFGANGAVIAAISVAAPTARFESLRTKMTEYVVSSAAEISRLLGAPRDAGPVSRPGPRPPRVKTQRIHRRVRDGEVHHGIDPGSRGTSGGGSRTRVAAFGARQDRRVPRQHEG
jgi:DNA-binding IclR family transcriptional regulator